MCSTVLGDCDIHRMTNRSRTHPSRAEQMLEDEANESELAAHRISPTEVRQVWMNRPKWAPNRKHRAGDWKMMGTTNGGRRLTIIVRFLPDDRALRPITGWDATPAERTRYFEG